MGATIQIIREATPWWLVVLPTFAGLAGAMIVAVYNNRSGTGKWRDDARLNAYSDFVRANHEVNRLVLDLLAQDADEVDIWPRLVSAVNEVARAASWVAVVGPRPIAHDAEAIQRKAEAFHIDLQDPVRRVAVRGMLAGKTDAHEYTHLVEFVAATDSFLIKAQGVLGTTR